MEIRPVARAEREICFDIFMRSLDDLRRRQGQEPSDPADMGWMPDSIEHLGETDPGDLILAIDGHDPVAFGCAYRRDTFWFLSYLFVLPASQGAGFGRALLERLLPPEPERASWYLATVVEASQPGSTMLYASYGIVPRVPLYWLEGAPALDRLPSVPGGLAGEPLSLGRHGPDLDLLDRELLGYARPMDHAMWVRESQAARVYRGARGTLAGYGYRGPDEWIGPVGAVDEELTAAIVRDLASLGGEGGTITLQVAGSAGTLLPQLLRAGLRSEEGAQLLYCSSERASPPSYVMYGGFLP